MNIVSYITTKFASQPATGKEMIKFIVKWWLILINTDWNWIFRTECMACNNGEHHEKWGRLLGVRVYTLRLINPCTQLGVFPLRATAPSVPGSPYWSRSHSDTLGRTPVDEWSTRRRTLPDNTHKRPKSTPPAGFEPAIPADERPQTHALDRAAPGGSTSLN